MDLTIRPAVPEDAPSMVPLVNAAGWGLPLQIWTALARLGEDPWEVGLRRVRSDDTPVSWRMAWIAEVSGVPAGLVIVHQLSETPEELEATIMSPLYRPFVELELQASDTAYIRSISVSEAMQSRRIGTRLLTFAGRFRGPEGTSVIVADSDGRSRRFFEAHGYAEAARRRMVKDNWQAPKTEWILMRERWRRAVAVFGHVALNPYCLNLLHSPGNNVLGYSRCHTPPLQSPQDIWSNRMIPHLEELIRQRAHEIWEQEGRPHGHHEDHWQRAASEITQELERIKATHTPATAEEIEAPTAPRRGRPRRSQSTEQAAAPRTRRSKNADNEHSAAAPSNPASSGEDRQDAPRKRGRKATGETQPEAAPAAATTSRRRVAQGTTGAQSDLAVDAAPKPRRRMSQADKAGSDASTKARNPRGTSASVAAFATQSGSSVTSSSEESSLPAVEPSLGTDVLQNAPSPPKYRHPEDAQLTWSGRGRRPVWIRDAIEAGRRLTDFEVGA